MPPEAWSRSYTFSNPESARLAEFRKTVGKPGGLLSCHLHHAVLGSSPPIRTGTREGDGNECCISKHGPCRIGKIMPLPESLPAMNSYQQQIDTGLPCIDYIANVNPFNSIFSGLCIRKNCISKGVRSILERTTREVAQ